MARKVAKVWLPTSPTELLRRQCMRAPISPNRGCAQRGFTMIEMMVVMVLLGLLTTLALPAMQRWHDAVQARAQSMGVVETLRAAAFAAGANRHQLRVDAASFQPAAAADAASAPGASRDHAQVTLPKGWQVDRIEPAAFLGNGLCSPGELSFKTESGAPVIIAIQGPRCSVGIADPATIRRR